METNTNNDIERNAEFPLLNGNYAVNNDAAVQATVAIQKWGRSLRASFAEIEPTGERDNMAHWTALKKVDDDLKAKTEALVESVAQFTNVKPILVQLAAERKMFKELYTIKWEKFCARRDAGKPAEKPEKRMLVLDATPSAWKKIETAISKAGVNIGVMMPLVNAKRIEAVGKIIKQIEDDEKAANAAMGGI